MSFRRNYTMQQVHDLICASEGRASPTTGAGGHSVGLHADGRHRTTADKRSVSTIILAATIEESRKMDPKDGITWEDKSSPGVDSRFTTRLDMVKAVFQGLNGPEGQNKLGELDASSSKNRIRIDAPLSPPVKNIERFTKSSSTLERNLVAHGVRLIIDRVGATSGIHIQTAFPTDVRSS